MSQPTTVSGAPAWYPSPYKAPSNPSNAFAGAAGYPNALGVTTRLAAIVDGTADITNAALYGVGGLLDTETLTLTVNGVAHTLVLAGAGNVANEAAFLAAIDAQWAGLLATQGPAPTKGLVLTDTLVPGGVIIVGAGSANGHLGLTPGTTNAPTGSARLALVGGRPVFATSIP